MIDIPRSHLASRAADGTETVEQAVVCHCLGVTEGEVREAVETCAIAGLRELGHCTGAGQGCTACHPALRNLMARHARPTVDAEIPVEA